MTKDTATQADSTLTADEHVDKKEKVSIHQSIVPLAHGSSEMQKLLEAKEQTITPRIGELLKGLVVSISKNGIVVDINGKYSGLVRGKELDDESGEYSKLAIGDSVEATVLDQENEQGMLELSFRQAGHRKAWDELEEMRIKGGVVDAKIIDANKGGLLVKVGNVEGFLPVSQLTVEHYPRVEGGDKNKILDRLKQYAGESFQVKIITVKEKEEKMIVSEKAAWEETQNKMLEKYVVGSTIEGRVSGVVDFGAFVEFGEGLEGLVHISELAWQRIDDPKDIVKVGDPVKAKIIAIDDGRVSLSIKKLQEDPWKTVAEKYRVGQVVKGTVVKVNPYGAFVELDQDIHGLAHISELGGGKKGANAADILKPGEEQMFKILSLEPGAHRLGLGLANGAEESDAKEAVVENSEAVAEEKAEEKE